MTAFDPSPALRWLFVFPHPDDEMAIAIWMHTLVNAGAAVSAAWLHSTMFRETESQHAMALIGFPLEQCFFLEGPDGGLAEWMPEMASRLEAVMDRTRPDRVVTAAFQQGHLDHDAAHLVVSRLVGGPILEFPLYHTYLRRFQRLYCFPDGPTGEVLSLTPEQRRLKKVLAYCYPSQRFRRNALLYEAISHGLLRRESLLAGEKLRWSEGVDHRVPAHSGALRGAIERSPQWRRWLEAVDRFEKAVGPR